jgi:hypothetical protein
VRLDTANKEGAVFFILANKYYFPEDKTINSQKYYYLAKKAMKRMFVLVHDVFRELASLGPNAKDVVLRGLHIYGIRSIPGVNPAF